MIKLYIPKSDDTQRYIIEPLEDAVVGFRTEWTEKDFVLEEDSGRKIQGEDEVKHYVDSLVKEKQQWDTFQSDACYCWDDEVDK